MLLNNSGNPEDLAKKSSQNSGLLFLLLELFTRITNRLWFQRLQCYNDSPHHDCDAFISPLEKLLEKLSAAESANAATECIRTTYLSNHESFTADGQFTGAGTETYSTLSDYFRSRNNILILSPYLSEKLKAAALENLHAAIRLTRQHDERIAKLHLQIARDAINELTHFLPAQELDDFFRQTISLTEQVAHYVHISNTANPLSEHKH